MRLDFSKNTAGAYGSAKDIANLLLYILKNRFSLMEATRFDEIEINQRKFKNTDYLVNDLAGFMAGKTGYSDLAGGNLAIVLDKGYGHPIIIVVLGSNFEGRFRDAKNLYEAVIVAAKRARKINDDNKLEFNSLLSTMTSGHEDEFEDRENPEQMKLSLEFEKREKAHINAVKELVDGKIEYRYKSENK